jgi:hypothetical protein
VSTSDESDPTVLTPNLQREQFQLQVLELHGYLDRLRQLAELRRGLPIPGQLDPVLQQALVDHALYSAYRDCVSAGAKLRAARILALPSRNDH